MPQSRKSYPQMMIVMVGWKVEVDDGCFVLDMEVGRKCYVGLDMVFVWSVNKWNCCKGWSFEAYDLVFGFAGFATQSLGGSSNQDLLLLNRMFDSAKALAFENVPTRDEIKEAIFQTLVTNGMFDNSHIRLSLTRGKKVTSGMSPAFNRYGCTLIVLAEWKPPVYDNTHGIVLVTASTRRNSPNNLDSKIHHNNLLNNILAKIEGNNAKADDAIMLDKDGYLSETNATNIFIVKKGCVLTPHADYCLPDITRATVMNLVVEQQLILEERTISLSEVHTAYESALTKTLGEMTTILKQIHLNQQPPPPPQQQCQQIVPQNMWNLCLLLTLSMNVHNSKRTITWRPPMLTSTVRLKGVTTTKVGKIITIKDRERTTIKERETMVQTNGGTIITNKTGINN
nr:branched-chain-amino-acid aminotransferase-like protein 1 [Arachis hypogaea]